MSLPSPPPAYSQQDQAQLRALIDQALDERVRRGGDIEMGPKGRLILTDTATGARKALKLTSGTLGTASV